MHLRMFQKHFILPSTVTFGLALFGCCSNQELFNSTKKLLGTGARIIFSL